jgi:AcrR family transcriptional regulator
LGAVAVPSWAAPRRASAGHNGAVNASRRGRPRSVDADEAILAATLELAGEVGINGMSMDDLAERAGVSKTTIYRRWTSKEQLVLDALHSAMGPLDDVDTGSLGDDLRAYLIELGERMWRGRMSDVLPHLIEVACHDDALRSRLDDYVQFRRAPMLEILRRGLERGQLPADTDVEVLTDVLLGPFIYRRLLTHAPLDATFVDRLLGVALTGHEKSDSS